MPLHRHPPPFGSLRPPCDTELDRGIREVETGAPLGVHRCDPHHRSYQPLLCKSSPVSPCRSTGVEVCQTLRVNISPICMANQYITVMENLLFCKQQHMTIAKIKALCSPIPLISRYFTCQPPPNLSLDPPPMLRRFLDHRSPG